MPPTHAWIWKITHTCNIIGMICWRRRLFRIQAMWLMNNTEFALPLFSFFSWLLPICKSNLHGCTKEHQVNDPKTVDWTNSYIFVWCMHSLFLSLPPHPRLIPFLCREPCDSMSSFFWRFIWLLSELCR